MKTIKVSCFCIVLAFTQTVNAQVSEPAGNAAAIADNSVGFIKSFLSIKGIMEAIEKTFSDILSKEQKDKIIGKTVFLQRNMRDLIIEKKAMYDEAKSTGSTSNQRISTVQKLFSDLHIDIKELNDLYKNKYYNETQKALQDLTSNLNKKQNGFDNVVKDITGLQNRTDAQKIADVNKTFTDAEKCMESIDTIIDNIKAKR